MVLATKAEVSFCPKGQTKQKKHQQTHKTFTAGVAVWIRNVSGVTWAWSIASRDPLARGAKLLCWFSRLCSTEDIRSFGNLQTWVWEQPEKRVQFRVLFRQVGEVLQLMDMCSFASIVILV